MQLIYNKSSLKKVGYKSLEKTSDKKHAKEFAVDADYKIRIIVIGFHFERKME